MDKYGLDELIFLYGNTVSGADLNKRILDIKIKPLDNVSIVVANVAWKTISDASPYQTLGNSSFVYKPSPSPVINKTIKWPGMKYDREATDPQDSFLSNNPWTLRKTNYWELECNITLVKFDADLSRDADITMRFRVKMHLGVFYRPNSPTTVSERLSVHAAPLDIEDFINKTEETISATITPQ